MKKSLKRKKVLESLNIFRNSYPLKLLIKYIMLWSVLIWIIVILYIYHIPAFNIQINLGVTLNSLMEKVERTQYQAALAITSTCRSKLYEEL